MTPMARVPSRANQIRYTLDEANRLVRQQRRSGGRWRTADVRTGSLSLDDRQRLVFRPDPDAAGASWPSEVRLDGQWRLGADHRLGLAVRDASGARRRTLHLRGSLASADAHSMGIELRRQTLDGRLRSERLTLAGAWHADRRNRLSFRVQRGRGAADRLTLQGAWDVDRRHTLRYRFRDSPSGRSRRELRFAGWWEVPARHRLVYRLDSRGSAAFEFRAALANRTLRAADGRVAYEAGIRLSGGRRVRRRIALYGSWKFGPGFSVTFDVPSSDARRSRVAFRARVLKLGPREVTVELRHGRTGQPVATLECSRPQTDRAGWFARVRSSSGRWEASAGVRVAF